MAKQDSTTDDVLNVISDLATLVSEQFDNVNEQFVKVNEQFVKVNEQFVKVNERFDEVNARLDGHDRRLDRIEDELRSLTTSQREMRQWIERVDNRLLGVESDIKEIYDRIVALEKLHEARGLEQAERDELRDKFDALTDWAKKVSKATGVPLPKF